MDHDGDHTAHRQDQGVERVSGSMIA